MTCLFMPRCLYSTSPWFQTTEAIKNFALPELVLRSTAQITGLVYLVQGELESGHRMTVEALIVLDVHGMCTFIPS